MYAYEFTDTTTNSSITAHKDTETSELSNRSHVMLKLKGNAGTASFKSEKTSDDNNGVYELGGEKPTESDGVLLSNVVKSKSDSLDLTGQAGTAALAGEDGKNGINDTFTLRLKIKKA